MEQITFDGYDGSTLEVRDINLWYDYYNRAAVNPKTKHAIIATVKHGGAGVLLERLGNGCKVRVKQDKKLLDGWVSFWFVKELKQEWNATRG